MVIKIISILCIFALELVQSAEYIPCNGQMSFTQDNQVIYIYWDPTYGDATTCTYLIKAPVDSFITATIYHNLAGSEPSCSAGQAAWVSRDADYSFRGASFFCGNRMSAPLQIKSIGNEMTLAIQSNSASGDFQVVLQYTRLTQSNCFCSWNVNSRIIAGANASPNEFTMQAAFKTNYNNQFNEVVCGGTILSQNAILTAAHCIYAFQNEYNWNILIHVGRHNVSAALNADTIYAATYSIQSAIVHNAYNPETNVNDIGIVKTTSYIKFNRGVGPACLPYKYQTTSIANGNLVTAVGWGATEYAMAASADKKSWILQKVSLTIDNTLGTCKGDNRKLCAKGAYTSIGTKDTCQRDSGGSIYKLENNLNYCLAVVSEGEACGVSNGFSTNTYIPYYIDWITSNLNGDFLCRK